jgi:hypothetical protein
MLTFVVRKLMQFLFLSASEKVPFSLGILFAKFCSECVFVACKLFSDFIYLLDEKVKTWCRLR